MKKWKKLIGCLITLVCIAGCAMLSPSGSKLLKVRDLAEACISYAVDHNDTLPNSMADLSPYVKGSTDLTQYEIVTSGKLLDVKQMHTTVLIRSINVSSEGARAVAFVDGHSELVYEQQKK